MGFVDKAKLLVLLITLLLGFMNRTVCAPKTAAYSYSETAGVHQPHHKCVCCPSFVSLHFPDLTLQAIIEIYTSCTNTVENLLFSDM